jgi:protein-tyrosine-phosphatase
MTDAPLNVLFLCTQNSARSVIAECVLNKLGAGRFRAHSAGSRPRGEIHPFARDMLAELGYDVSGLRSKSWDEFAAPDAPKLDFVFTVCDNAAAEPCPIWPGQPVSAHWGVPDPAAASGSDAERRLAFADAHRMLYQRISIFTNLPIDSLDRLSLQQRVEDIGKATADSATPTEETQ